MDYTEQSVTMCNLESVPTKSSFSQRFGVTCGIIKARFTTVDIVNRIQTALSGLINLICVLIAPCALRIAVIIISVPTSTAMMLSLYDSHT